MSAGLGFDRKRQTAATEKVILKNFYDFNYLL